MSLDPSPAPITVRIKDACRMTGIGRSKLYLLIAEGAIETIKVGSERASKRLRLTSPTFSHGPQYAPDAQLHVEELALQKLASDQKRPGVLGRWRFCVNRTIPNHAEQLRNPPRHPCDPS